MQKIKLITLVVVSICLNANLFGQQDSTKFKLTRIELSNGYASNHLTGQTALPFAFNSAVKTDDITKSSNLLFKQNRTGAESHISINFNINKHEFTLGQYSTLGASYSKNLYQLIFEGNAPYAGQKMDLRLHAKQLGYTKLSYHGAWKTKLSSPKPSLVYRHHVSLYGISAFTRAKTTDENYLLTSESGIDAEAKLNYNYQANVQSGIKGAGIGVGTYLYTRKGSTAKILQIENVGFGFIKSNEQVYSRDTAWNYSGVQFNLGSTQSFSDVGDSIENLIYIEGKSDAKLILLPINIQYTVQSSKSSYGARYVAMPGYLPQLHYLKKYYTSKNNTYGIGAKLGGWGLLNSYLQYNMFLKKEGSSLQLQMTGLESLLLPYPSFAVQMCLEL